MTPRERLKQDLDAVHMPPGTRAKIASDLRRASARRRLRIPGRTVAIAAAMLLFFGMGAGAMLLRQYFMGPDTPVAPVETLEATPTPRPILTPPPNPALGPLEPLALVTPGQYTDTAELRVWDDSVDVVVTLGDGTVLTTSYNIGENHALDEVEPVFYHADFKGGGTEEIVVCISQRQRWYTNERMMAEVHVLEVTDGQLKETLTVIDRLLDHDFERFGDTYFFLPKTDDNFGMEEYPFEPELWLSDTVFGATIGEFEGRPALNVVHIPRLGIPYTVFAWSGTEWAIVKQGHDPRPEMPRSDTEQETDTGTIWWRYRSPGALSYGETIQFCPVHGFFNEKQIIVDPRFGPMGGAEPGHGGGSMLWLYDPARDEMAKVVSSEGGAEIAILTRSEYSPLLPEWDFGLVFEADFDKIDYGGEFGPDVYPALTGKCGVLYGDQMAAGLIYDNPDRLTSKHGPTVVALSAVKQGDKYGVVDGMGRVVVPFELDDILPIDGETVFALYDGVYGVIDVTKCVVYG